MTIQGLNREEDYLLLLNNRGIRVYIGLNISSIIKNSHRPIPLSLITNLGKSLVD